MNQDVLTKAQELQKQGYSIRQIAAELAISKSQVFRWLNGQSGNGGNALPIDLITKTTNTKQHVSSKNKNNMENNNDQFRLEKEIALKKLQLEHELEMRKLAQQDKELELRKREIELRHLLWNILEVSNFILHFIKCFKSKLINVIKIKL